MAEYLGDGVYASFDGYRILLDLRTQSITNCGRIGLAPPVLRKLVEYRKNIDEHMQEHIAQMEATSND